MEEEYINFGDELILKSDFLKAINDAKAYSATQPWSAARRGAFDAVSELAANRGILSTRKYTNPETGESMYYATFGGDPFDINTYDKNTRRGWLDYVNFVGRLAESLPTKKSIDEKKKKEEEERIAKLPTFDNTAFTNLLTENISKGPLGGQKWDVNLWNTLDDVRNEKTGAVGIDNRKTELIKLLRDIDKNFKAKDYNWEDSPFKDADDFKARLAKAIGALESKDLNDDTPALRELGLNYKDWFNNRTGEIYGEDKAGNPVTYGAYYRALLELKDVEAKAAAAKASAARANQWKAFSSWDFSKFAGRPLTAEESNTTYLNNLFAKGKWTADENSQIVLAFKLAEKNGQLVELSKEELAKLPSTWKNRGKYLRKINGLSSPFYYDTLSKLFKLFHNNDLNTTKTSFLNVLDLNNSELLKKVQLEKELAEQLKFLLNIEWTADLTRELAGIAADVVSVIDPEPVSAGIAALTGTGLRTYNRWNDKDGFTLTDAGHTALDTGLSLLGMIPVVGDAALTARVIGKLQKAAGWLGAAFAAASVPQAAKAAWNKVVNGQDMTVDDWRAIGNVLMGATLARRIQLNRAAGNAVKNLSGGVKTEKAAEVEVKIGDKVETVQISKQEADELKRAYKKAGNSLEETSKALKNSRAVKRELEAKKYTKELIEKLEAPQAASGSVRGRIPGAHDIRGIKNTTRTILTEGSVINENSPLRVLYMNNNSGFWKRGNYGWNINGNNSSNRLKSLWDRFKNPYSTPETKPTETPSTTPKAETSTPKSIENKQQTQVPRSRNEIRRDWKNTIERKLFSTNDVKSGEYNITNPKDSKFNVNFKVSDKNSEGFRTLIINGSNPVKIKTLKLLLEKIALAIKSYRNTVNNSRNKAGINHKEVGRILRELKAKGWLKHGGTLTLDKTIENFLKNNNI